MASFGPSRKICAVQHLKVWAITRPRTVEDKCVLATRRKSASGICPIKFAIAANDRFPLILLKNSKI